MRRTIAKAFGLDAATHDLGNSAFALDVGWFPLRVKGDRR